MDPEESIEAEAEAFVNAMFNYVFRRRFYKQAIPMRFDGIHVPQPTNIYFHSDIGEAILLLCYVNGNSFLNKFLFDYPDYAADIGFLFKYCEKFALEICNEGNIFNSLLMFSSMIIEMVSYCLKPYVESGTEFVNLAGSCWSSAFEDQFKRPFFISGGWEALQEISREKGRIYEDIKQKYPPFPDDVLFHYWIGDVSSETTEKFVLDASLWRLRDRTHQIIQSNLLYKSLFQEIDSSDEHETVTKKQSINVPASDLGHACIDSFSNLSLHENKNLKDEVSKSPDSISEYDPTYMDVDSNFTSKSLSETKSVFGAIPKTVEKTGVTCPTVTKFFDLNCISKEDDLISGFKDKVFFKNVNDGKYLERLSSRTESEQLLISDGNFSRLMRDTVDNRDYELDTKRIVEDARRIIAEATTSAKINSNLENETIDIFIGSSEDLKLNIDVKNTSAIDLSSAVEVKLPAEVEHQQKDFPYGLYRQQIGKKSIGNIYGLKCKVHYDPIAMASLKNNIVAARRTLNMKQGIEPPNDHEDILNAMEPKYISKIVQHLNYELGTMFYASNLLQLNLVIPYTRQGTGTMMELMNFRHTLMGKVQDQLKTLKNCSLTKRFEGNLKQLISKGAETRIAITTLGRSNQLKDRRISQYFTELIRVLIGECAYFLKLEDMLGKRAGYMKLRDFIDARPKKSILRKYRKRSTSESSIRGRVSPKLSKADDRTENRKKRQYQRKQNVGYSTSKLEMETTSSSESTAAHASKSAGRGRTKRQRLPMQMTDSSPWEGILHSSDSEENKN